MTSICETNEQNIHLTGVDGHMVHDSSYAEMVGFNAVDSKEPNSALKPTPETCGGS